MQLIAAATAVVDFLVVALAVVSALVSARAIPPALVSALLEHGGRDDLMLSAIQAK
jgi:hypothetical protein